MVHDTVVAEFLHTMEYFDGMMFMTSRITGLSDQFVWPLTVSGLDLITTADLGSKSIYPETRVTWFISISYLRLLTFLTLHIYHLKIYDLIVF